MTNWIDDIMVTGYFLLALMAYTKSTGDDRYTKKGSLKMQVTENAVYQHDIHSCYEALITNWNKSELTLFPCEVRPPSLEAIELQAFSYPSC